MSKKNPKQNSIVFHKLEAVVKQVTDCVTGMDHQNDTSHGLMFSSALNDQETGVNTNLVVWGSEKDIASMLFTACMKNPALAGIVSKVAINIAVQRVRKQQGPKQKLFTGDDATLMVGNDHSLVIPEDN